MGEKKRFFILNPHQRSWVFPGQAPPSPPAPPVEAALEVLGTSEQEVTSSSSSPRWSVVACRVAQVLACSPGEQAGRALTMAAGLRLARLGARRRQNR